ncbi:MAG: 5-methylcytosine-specific restriction endonuclease system specificity protein McrC [Defluviitaleaceae bacterium]|nr:5-methylcytosine-specific restriction endonuclease system specificity protein McrC [Defluviitaleaceae bacterium]
MRKIPIKNIYYMLAYAFNALNHRDYEKLQGEDFENIYDLLASVLVRAVGSQVKMGLHREYIEEQATLSGIKGRIQINESIKAQAFIKGKLICSFDELDHNVLMNQIIKTTFIHLTKCEMLDPNVKKNIKSLMLFFTEIDTVELWSVAWDSIKFNRSNNSYKIIIDVCYLVFKGLLVNESEGFLKFATFIEDRQMSLLYEKFVLNFFKTECAAEVDAKSEFIDWYITSGESLSLLPKMKTDISLYSKKESKLLIVDTKFYPNALQANFDHRTFISGHMYQIFSYVQNSRFSSDVSGMLLYPTVDYTIDECVEISGKNIYVKTLNLNQDFEYIRKELMGICNAVIK